jgi:hypothetical protein
MITEESIRQAFHGRAELAADPATAVIGVRAKIKTRRRQRRGAAAIAAVAVAAAVIPGLDLAQQQKAGPAAQPWPAGPLLDPVRIPMKPSWLPKGLRETGRVVAVGRTAEERSYAAKGMTEETGSLAAISIERERSSAGHASDGSLGLAGATPMYVMADQPGKEKVTSMEINGLPAHVYDQKVTCRVAWMAADGAAMLVRAEKVRDIIPDPCAAAKKVAGSLLPDSETTLTSGLAANWLPAGWHTEMSGVGTGPYDWDYNAPNCNSWLMLSKPGEEQVTIAIDRGEVSRLSVPLTIRGRNAYMVETPTYMGDLRVDLGGGRRMTISHPSGAHPQGPLSHADLLKIAENVAVGPQPDCSWG